MIFVKEIIPFKMTALKIPKKLKTILSFTIIGIVAIVTIYFTLNFYHRIKQPVLNGYLAVPEQTIAMVEIKQAITFWNLVLKKSSLWNNIKSIDTKNEKTKFIESFLANTLANTSISNNLDAQKLIISFQETEANQLEPLFIVEFNENSSENNVWKYFTSLAGEAKKEITIDEKTVFQSILSPKTSIYYFNFRGLIIASFSEKIIALSINKIYSGINSLSKDFENIYATVGKKVQANIFINHKNLAILIKNKFQNTFATSFTENNGIGLWTATDVILSEDKLLISGFTNVSDSASFLRNISTPSVENDFLEYISSGTQVFLNISTSNPKNFLKNSKSYLNQNFNKYIQTYNINPDSLLSKIKIKTITYLINKNNKALSLIETSDTIGFSQFISFIQKKTSYPKAKPAKNAKFQHIILVNHIPSFLSSNYSYADTVALCVLNNFILIGPSEESLNEIIDSYNNRDLLYLKQDFHNIYESILNNSGMIFYSKNIFSSILDKKILLPLHSPLPNLINQFMIQFLYEKENLFLTNAVLTFSDKDLSVKNFKDTIVVQPLDNNDKEEVSNNSSKDSKGNIRLKLRAPIYLDPNIIIDHNDKSDKVIVFDQSSNMYMIDNEGKINWSRKIEGLPLGKINQIDYFKNGKKQLLFNTKERIYLIDIKGKDIEGFPVKMKKTATNGLTVIDYENKQNYRILIAMNDNGIYNLDINCRPIADWNIIKTKKEVKTPILFCRANAKDYIIVIDNDNNANFYNRRGEPMLKKISPLKIAKNTSFVSNGKELITTDASGNFITITSSAGIIRTKTLKLKAEHYLAQSDFNNDGNKEYIVVDDNVLSVLNSSFKIINTIKLPASIYYAPSVNNSKKFKNLILLTNITKAEVYLLAGKLLDTVVEGKSSAILVKSKNKEYIVSAIGQEIIFTLLE